MPPRAPALPPDERRAAIIAAARPLLLQYADRVTTRQVAEAAGIAEGTIFRAFENKDHLVQAVVESLMDPAETCRALDGISRTLPLEERCRLALAQLQEHVEQLSTVLTALVQATNGHREPGRMHECHQEGSRMLVAALARVLEPDADQLRCTPTEAASMLRSLAFATGHPHVGEAVLTDPERLTSLLLYGITQRP
ncbi:TetR/AcrR family transcriptional regulator [Luteococcus sp. OSA5]|uniref:TetR/AcrR family transcriptional regulator n=1 Tax=Luteococcus sp. OSA5 TaxID=3401630 RepID=UPI003B4380B0